MDVVVTVPLRFGLINWIEEGDPAGSPESGEEWDFYLSRFRPKAHPGDRVYVVYNGLIRGYAPLVRVEYSRYRGCYSLIRRGGAVAITIPQQVKGFRGFRYRWWNYEDEIPFPDWMNPSAVIPERMAS